MEKELESIMKENHISEILPADVLKQLKLFSYSKDEIIVYAGEKSSNLSIIVSGRCLVKPIGVEGQETILTYLYPGDLIGDIELFTKRDYLHYVYADTDVKLLKIPANLVNKQLASYVPFLHFVIDNTFEKLLNHSTYFSDARLYGSKARLVKYILDVSYRLNAKEIPFIIEDVAPFIGVSERHLRRIIKDLENEKLIEKKYRKLQILKMNELKERENKS